MKKEKKSVKQQVVEPKKSTRPLDEVVLYPEIEFEVRELVAETNKVMIGPPRLTRFERARITGARSLQLSLGAPSLIPWTDETRDTISIATAELDAKALPISIRRILPNGLYQDIPVEWLR
jgi:DNA-directed RNA polymerase I, II, and III subunit RPABC2